MSGFPPPNPPYLGPPKFHGDDNNKPIHWLVIHSTVSPCVPGGARSIAAYFRDRVTTPSSAHYVTDPAEAAQVTYDSVEAYHCGYNLHSLGFEMCDVPGPLPEDKPHTAAYRAARRAWRWIRPNQRAMLRVTARLVAEAALAYDVPIRFVGPRALAAGERGITTHACMSKAFHRSTHWDPGFWPRRRFIRLVQAEADAIRAEHHRHAA